MGGNYETVENSEKACEPAVSSLIMHFCKYQWLMHIHTALLRYYCAQALFTNYSRKITKAVTCV